MAKLQNQLLSLKETQALIESGQLLLIAGSQGLLDQLPAGQWLGGTTPYFMSKEGAQKDLNRLFVSNLSDLALNAKLKAIRPKSWNNYWPIGPKMALVISHYPLFQRCIRLTP